MKCQQPLSFCFNMFQHSQSFTRYDAKIAAPNNYNTECRVLIENGDLDQEVPKDTIVEPWALWILRGSCGVMVTSSLFNWTLLELCMIHSQEYIMTIHDAWAEIFWRCNVHSVMTAWHSLFCGAFQLALCTAKPNCRKSPIVSLLEFQTWWWIKKHVSWFMIHDVDMGHGGFHGFP